MARDTRAKILDAATRLFADADSRGASLRAIARAAGVNSALIHYHFGNRESLFEAVVLNALAPVQARRHAMLETLRAEGSPSAPKLAELFVTPLLPRTNESSEQQAIQLRLLARAYTEQRELVQDLILKNFGGLMRALGEVLGEALPMLPAEIKNRRMRLSAQTALETLSGPEMATAQAKGDEALEALVNELIDFLAGGLEAPATHPSRT